jgi:hypothetical protein
MVIGNHLSMPMGHDRGFRSRVKFYYKNLCCNVANHPSPPLIFLQPDLNPKLDTHLFFVLETAEHVLVLTSTDRCLSIFALISWFIKGETKIKWTYRARKTMTMNLRKVTFKSLTKFLPLSSSHIFNSPVVESVKLYILSLCIWRNETFNL